MNNQYSEVFIRRALEFKSGRCGTGVVGGTHCLPGGGS